MLLFMIFPFSQEVEVLLRDQNGVSLSQRVSETEAYFSLLQENVSTITNALNSSEEAKQLTETTKTMMEALCKCIDLLKSSQMTSIEHSPPSALSEETSNEDTRLEAVLKETTKPVVAIALPVENIITSSETSSELRCVCL